MEGNAVADTTCTPRAFSPDDFAAVVGLGRTTVYKLLRENAIRSITVGRRRLIPAEEIDRLLAQA